MSPGVPHGISESPPGHDLQHGDGGLLEAKPLGKGEKRAIFSVMDDGPFCGIFDGYISDKFFF